MIRGMASSSRRGNAREAVDRLLDDLSELNTEDTLLMAQLWSDEDSTARQRAWGRAKTAIGRAGLADLLESARVEVGQWMQATPADYQGISGLLGRQSDHISVRASAAPAVLDAVAGVLAQPDLLGDDYDVLLRPWSVANEEDDAQLDARRADWSSR